MEKGSDGSDEDDPDGSVAASSSGMNLNWPGPCDVRSRDYIITDAAACGF